MLEEILMGLQIEVNVTEIGLGIGLDFSILSVASQMFAITKNHPLNWLPTTVESHLDNLLCLQDF
jgi:hypothetical protein